jgi:hypothetical protein
MPKCRKLRRSDLKPGMIVTNSITGQVGIVRADPDRPERLRGCNPDYVAIARMGPKQRTYPYWCLTHLRVG